MKVQTTLIVISSLIIGIFLGNIFPFMNLNEEEIQSLEKNAEALEEFQNNVEPYQEIVFLQIAKEANEKLRLLELAETNKIDDITALMIKDLGLFYYSYSSEVDREMTSLEIKESLQTLELKAKSSSTFKEIIDFKPHTID